MQDRTHKNYRLYYFFDNRMLTFHNKNCIAENDIHDNRGVASWHLTSKKITQVDNRVKERDWKLLHGQSNNAI